MEIIGRIYPLIIILVIVIVAVFMDGFDFNKTMTILLATLNAPQR